MLHCSSDTIEMAYAEMDAEIERRVGLNRKHFKVVEVEDLCMDYEVDD